MKNIFFGILLLSTVANADVLLDPYLGYVISGSNTGGAKVTGNDLGVRLGFNTLGFGLGIDATLSGTYKYESSGVSTDATPSHQGVFVSYAFPILVRGYATYFVNSKLSSGAFTYKGTGTKIGVQFTGLPLVAIGLEVLTSKYTDLEFSGSTVSISETETQTRLAISAPFYF